MILLKLAVKSLLSRKLTSCLTILSIALSVALLLSVERTRRSSEEGFTQAISQTDLIVGAKTSPLNLILYTVFNLGSPTNNVSWETYQHFKNHPAVAWTIPYSLGDGHRGFRVVGTTKDFFDNYHYQGGKNLQIQSGAAFEKLWQVVLGAEVAAKFQYQLGQKIIVSHGVTRGEALLHHDNKPFTVVGILAPTGTPVDRAVYLSLESLEAIHLDWKDGAMPSAGKEIAPENIHEKDLKIGTITAFFLRTKNRIETLALQREINTFPTEALLAAIPGATLAELWQSLGYFEKALRAISWLVILVGLVSMMVALLTGLNERRREMAILRAIGAGPGKILGLLLVEAFFITLVGIFIGILLHFVGFQLVEQFLLTEFGISLVKISWGSTEIFYLVSTLLLGSLAGIVPAMMAARQSLKDGLRI